MAAAAAGLGAQEARRRVLSRRDRLDALLCVRAAHAARVLPSLRGTRPRLGLQMKIKIADVTSEFKMK